MEQTTPTLYTIIVYTENYVGLLNQITIVFTRRGLNIESLSVGPSSIDGIHEYTITCRGERELLEKVIQQIEKRIGVLRAFLLTDEQIVYQEVALYKIPTVRLLEEPYLKRIIREHHARIMDITHDYTIIEKTGHSEETQALLEQLKAYDIRQFTCSGRIAVTKSPVESLTLFLREQERRHAASISTNMTND